ncbi:MAG TPA: DUF2268 domain-containing putative Zn-dependent protease [Actinomycetota bacterium]|nr:DUF2268 domain-containing putative Zn-dependent protease [Actinomycetota bacterium]
MNVSSAVIQSARASDTDIAPIVSQALRRITHLLPGLNARVDMGVDPKGVIHEIGIGGRSDPSTGDVTIAVDPASQNFATTLRVWLPALLAHELDHAKRTDSGPGSGHTLLDAMVFEGVADAFSIQAFPQTPPIPQDDALSRSEEKAAWHRARGRLYDLLDMAEYRSWFFGTGQLPRWTGYTLGFRIVSSFLARHPGETAASITSFSATRIFQGSGCACRLRRAVTARSTRCRFRRESPSRRSGVHRSACRGGLRRLMILASATLGWWLGHRTRPSPGDIQGPLAGDQNRLSDGFDPWIEWLLIKNASASTYEDPPVDNSARWRAPASTAA